MKIFILTVAFFLITIQSFAQDDSFMYNICKNDSYSWGYRYDTITREDYLIKGDSTDFYATSLSKMIKRINQNNYIVIRLIKIQNSIPYIEIVNQKRFQKMANFSSTLALATIVFDLTEVKGVKKVYIDYDDVVEDIESPGFFDREHFYHFFKIGSPCTGKKD